MPDQFQYVRLPDGSYGKFAANATDAQIRAQIAKNFTSIPAKTQPADTFKLMSEKPPENARFPALGRTGYRAADFLLNLLPGAGAALGGMQVETGPGAAAAAALGGMTGERAQRYLQDLLYKDLPSQTAREALTSMGTQGILGTMQEFGARLPGKLVAPAMRALLKSAETIPTEAESTTISGRARQWLMNKLSPVERSAPASGPLTPGQATGNKMLQTAESTLEHWPGSAGQMEKMDARQLAYVNQAFDEQLNAISKQNLSQQQTAEQIQKLVKGAEEKATRQAEDAYKAAYGKVKTTLGIPQDATKDEIEAFMKQRANPASVYDPYLKQNFTLPGKDVSVAREQLANADRLFQAEKNRIRSKFAMRIINTDNPELIYGYFAKGGSRQAGILRAMPPQVRQNVARNVLENFIAPAREVTAGETPGEILSVAKLSKSLDDGLRALEKNGGKSYASTIFDDQYDKIIQANQYLKTIAKSESGLSGKMHIAALLTELIGIPATTLSAGLMSGHPMEGAMAGMVAGPAAAALDYMAMKTFAWALTNPEKSATLLRLLRGAAATAVRGGFAVGQELQSSPAYYPLPKLEMPSAQP